MKKIGEIAFYLLVATVVATAIFSCSSLKLSKNKNAIKSDSVISITENTKQITESEVKDNSSIIILEKVDTIIKTDARNITAIGQLQDLQKGDTINADSETMSIKVFKDNKGKIHAKAISKPQQIKVHKTISKQIKNNVTTTNRTNNVQKTQIKSEVKKDIKTLEIQKSKWSFPWWIYLIIILIVLGTIGYFVVKKYIKIQTGGLIG